MRIGASSSSFGMSFQNLKSSGADDVADDDPADGISDDWWICEGPALGSDTGMWRRADDDPADGSSDDWVCEGPALGSEAGVWRGADNTGTVLLFLYDRVGALRGQSAGSAEKAIDITHVGSHVTNLNPSSPSPAFFFCLRVVDESSIEIALRSKWQSLYLYLRDLSLFKRNSCSLFVSASGA